MRIISLLGSPHGLKGNTAELLEIVLRGASGLDAENETLVLKGDSVLPCRGCNFCHKKGGCAQDDDFKSIARKIGEADALILASPNYVFSVSAQLKAFMDRCCGVIHRLGFEGRYGASVVTSGGGDEAGIAEYMNHFLMATGIVPVGSVWATMGAISGNGFPKEIEQKAMELGRKLVTSWKNHEKPAGVQEQMNVFYERMKALMLYRGHEWPYEYDYWMTHRNLTRD